MSSSSVSRFKFSNLLGKGMWIQIGTRWIMDPDPFQNVTDPEHCLYMAGVKTNLCCQFLTSDGEVEYDTNHMSILCCSKL